MNNEEYKEDLFDTFDNDSDNNNDDIIEKINIINKQIDQMKKRNDAINANIEDIMIDLHNNCEFMGNRLSSIAELIKITSDEEIKASTNNYRKAYDTLVKVAILIFVTNFINLVLLTFLNLNISHG
jgi:hypothetical protein